MYKSHSGAGRLNLLNASSMPKPINRFWLASSSIGVLLYM
jgi:hypothetical protein